MPTPRRPLGPICPNKVKKRELTPYKRGLIAGASLFGHKPSSIATALNKPESTIRSTLEVDSLRNKGESLPRPGRPRE